MPACRREAGKAAGPGCLRMIISLFALTLTTLHYCHAHSKQTKAPRCGVRGDRTRAAACRSTYDRSTTHSWPVDYVHAPLSPRPTPHATSRCAPAQARAAPGARRAGAPARAAHTAYRAIIYGMFNVNRRKNWGSGAPHPAAGAGRPRRDPAPHHAARPLGRTASALSPGPRIRAPLMRAHHGTHRPSSPSLTAGHR